MLSCSLLCLSVFLSQTPPASSPREVIASVVDDWHDAAARADEARYFNHLSEDAVFFGTDGTERWNKEAFRAYAHPHFAKGKAWSFTPHHRTVFLSPDGNTAWFDEALSTLNMGPCRGTGVLVKEAGRWKIAQYNLSVPIPNALLKDFKARIAGAPAPKPGAP